MTRALLAALALCAVLAVAACGSDEQDDVEPAAQQPGAETEAMDGSGADRQPGSADAPDAQQQRDRPQGIEITTAESQFGAILFDADRRAIYLFDKEKAGESECYGECAAAWPPVLTKGEPQATGAVRGKLLGTTKRDDGKLQVTYDGRPLYYYVDDPPGEVLCHNVFEFGGLWLVLKASGQPVA